MNPVDLQELVDRQLKQLPTPPAPRTLLPRVLEATVNRPALPWYRSGWASWPVAWQTASVLALMALAVAAWWLIPGWREVAPAAESPVSVPQRVSAWVDGAGQMATVVRVFWRVVLGPVAVYLFGLALSLTLACAVIWTALERLTLGGASQQ